MEELGAMGGVIGRRQAAAVRRWRRWGGRTGVARGGGKSGYTALSAWHYNNIIPAFYRATSAPNIVCGGGIGVTSARISKQAYNVAHRHLLGAARRSLPAYLRRAA